MKDRGSTPVIAPDLLWKLVDEDAVVISVQAGEVQVLNSVGTAVWRMLAESKAIDEIETFLVSHFDVTEEKAHDDLTSFLHELSERDLLTWEGEAHTESPGDHR